MGFSNKHTTTCMHESGGYLSVKGLLPLRASLAAPL